jgi:hypothetical protein
MSTLRHGGKKCGGNLHLDISSQVALISPSFILTVNGITAGILETVRQVGNTVEFICAKCQIKIPIQEIECQCFICRKFFLHDKIVVLEQVPTLCTDCYRKMSEDISGLTAREVEMKQLITLPANTIKKTLQQVFELGIRL